jgi:general transcription factor 3C polypeptide 3 (transcription factor C subunit 4)
MFISYYTDFCICSGVIYEEMNRLERAVEFFIIAAHLSKRDIELWRHAAIMSKELGNFNRAIYCFNKILKIEPNDTEALWER